MKDIKEEILSAWIMMNSAIDSEHIVSSMPYNEAIICNILANQKDKEITATDLCAILKMQKSQMNRTLTSLESRNLIKRVRSLTDKRQIIIKLIDDVDSIYYLQHQRSINYVESLLEKIGLERANEIIRLFNIITEVAQNNKK